MSERRKSPLEPEEIEPQMCSTDLRLQILHDLPFFAGLSHQEVQEINRSFREHGYQPGQFLYFSGDPARRFYVVASGKVKLLRHSADGKEVLVDLLVPGEFFGALSGGPQDVYQDTAQAHTLTCALAIEAEDFRRVLASHPGVALAVLDEMAARLQAAHEQVRQLSVHSVEQRIAHTLLTLGAKLGKKAPEGLLIQAPLSREDLAGMTGTTPESASRVMSAFQKDGLVASGRQWIAITDWDGLQAVEK